MTLEDLAKVSRKFAFSRVVKIRNISTRTPAILTFNQPTFSHISQTTYERLIIIKNFDKIERNVLGYF